MIAGGARGIGGQVARDVVAAGGRVAIGDVNVELGTELAAELGADSALFQSLDVTEEASCGAFVAATAARFGIPSGLVNSAISINGGALLDLPLDAWRKTIDVGLNGAFLMGRSFARCLGEAGTGGAVVNLSSVAAFNPYGGSGAYSTVKAAIVHLSGLMALEWAPLGIRVNAVAPGTVETPLTAYLNDPEVRRVRSETIPLGRVGQPEDVSALILYLLGDAASWVTASTMVVDGGVNQSLMNHIPGRSWGR